MMSAAFIGIDLAQLVIQVLSINISKLVVTKRLRWNMVLAFFVESGALRGWYNGYP